MIPRETRTPVSLMATLWSDRLDPRQIEIRNLSRRGMGVRCRVDTPAAGEQVVVHIPDLPSISGSVRWSRGDQCGIMLDRDLDPALFEQTGGDQPAEPPRPGIDLDF